MTKIEKKIGLLLNTKQIDIEDGIELAQSLNIDTLQLYAFHEKQNLAGVSKTRQVQLKNCFSNSGIKIASLAISFGPQGILSTSENILMDKFKQLSEFGSTLESTITSAHIGKIPSNEDSPVYEKMLATCHILGSISQSHGSVFAIETGSEKADVLETFLKKINSKGLGVNFDPANILMQTNENPIKSLKILKEYIVQTHVKDCKKIDNNQTSFYKEMAVGKGEIDFQSLFSLLDQNNYKGLHVIENNNYFDASNGIRHSVEFLNKMA